jgi:hypothetical protein
MRPTAALLPLLALASLCGCGHRDGGGISRSARHGRYAGIGVFDAGVLWSKMAIPNKPAAAQAATTADDEHIIVVVDTDTGEVRECGDHSGYCTAIDPWTQGIALQQRAPVPLTAHAEARPDPAATNESAAASHR